MSRKSRVEVDTLLPFEGNASFRTKRPAFADAIDLLSSRGWPLGPHGGRIKVGCFRLPNGSARSLIVVVGNDKDQPNVGLPWCSSVIASDTYCNRSEYEPHQFHDALIDEDANVTLCCGVFLHSCVVNTKSVPMEWSSKKRPVIDQLIVFIGAQRIGFSLLECRPGFAGFVPYTPAIETATANDGMPVSRFCVTNYAALHQIDLSHFKLEAFYAYHQQVTDDKKQRLSRQSVANILREVNRAGFAGGSKP